MRRQVNARLGFALVALTLAAAPRAVFAGDVADPDGPPPAEEPKVKIVLRRPGDRSRNSSIPVIDPSQVPPPMAVDPRETLEVPDRWRVLEGIGAKDHAFNPYAQNTLKGDKPFAPATLGREWFVNVSLVPETVAELRNIPVPVPAQVSTRPGESDVFGNGRSQTVIQQLLPSISLIRGDTTFRPPDYEFKFAPAINFNVTWTKEAGLLTADPTDAPNRRTKYFVGIQEAFVDRHLRNASVRYDFDSVRAGIQPFTSDFRGFLFQDAALGIRFFGTRANNTRQYNLAWFRRIEKDTNSGLNDLTEPLREDDVFVANLYLQDLVARGHTTQFTVLWNHNREEATHYDRNGFRVRPALLGDNEPHSYDVVYLGWNGDGHFGRVNVTHSIYAALGHDSHDVFERKPQDILAGFGALEPSIDFDWIRLRGSFVFATGDTDPYGGRETGFDAVVENPQIAGASTSFWIRQSIPFIGGGGVGLSSRNGVLASLRSSGDEGQSNFVNPGLVLGGAGADFNLTPEWRLLANVYYLRFATTEVLAALKTQGRISPEIGEDLSAGIQYRPFLNQNVVFLASAATLVTGRGYRELFDAGPKSGLPYSFLTNLILRY